MLIRVVRNAFCVKEMTRSRRIVALSLPSFLTHSAGFAFGKTASVRLHSTTRLTASLLASKSIRMGNVREICQVAMKISHLDMQSNGADNDLQVQR